MRNSFSAIGSGNLGITKSIIGAAFPAGIAYLATPYSKFKPDPAAAFRAACKIAAHLVCAGIKVYSPIAHTHPIAVHGALDLLDHAIWLPFDEAMMEASSVLIVAHLEGWNESIGIAHEVKFFEERGRPIYDLDPRSLMMVRRAQELPL